MNFKAGHNAPVLIDEVILDDEDLLSRVFEVGNA